MPFNDATCPRCKTKIRWSGPVDGRPPCPHCGHQVDPAELRKVEQRLEAIRQRFLDDDDDDDTNRN